MNWRVRSTKKCLGFRILLKNYRRISGLKRILWSKKLKIFWKVSFAMNCMLSGKAMIISLVAG